MFEIAVEIPNIYIAERSAPYIPNRLFVQRSNTAGEAVCPIDWYFSGAVRL